MMWSQCSPWPVKVNPRPSGADPMGGTKVPGPASRVLFA
jgi:hypothetical protein